MAEATGTIDRLAASATTVTTLVIAGNERMSISLLKIRKTCGNTAGWEIGYS
jgi:hypothetical protein